MMTESQMCLSGHTPPVPAAPGCDLCQQCIDEILEAEENERHGLAVHK